MWLNRYYSSFTFEGFAKWSNDEDRLIELYITIQQRLANDAYLNIDVAY